MPPAHGRSYPDTCAPCAEGAPATFRHPSSIRLEIARLNENILWLHALRLTDLARVGGKNSSLGEMIGNLANLGVSVPGGYATTAEAFKDFIAHNNLHQRIYDKLATLDVEDVPALTKAGGEIRGWVIDAPLQPDLATSPLPFAPPPPPKTCRTPPSPASRKPSST